MTERPAIFDAESVLAILDGRKTQTRRALKVQPPDGTLRLDPWLDSLGEWQYERGRPLWVSTEADGTRRRYGCPYGKPGDHLWVREAWGLLKVGMRRQDSPIFYRADPRIYDPEPHWRSPIHLPRALSRLTLEIADVRAERLQAIATSEADCLAEGIVCETDHSGPQYGPAPGQLTNRTAYAAFARRWDAINKARGFGWASNCWVWVVTFKRLEGVQ